MMIKLNFTEVNFTRDVGDFDLARGSFLGEFYLGVRSCFNP